MENNKITDGSGSQFVFESTHSLYYSTEKAVPVADIAKALIALEKIILSSEKAFEGITAVEVDKIEVLISKLESGSLSEEILIRFFFKDQAGLDAFIAKVRSKTLEGGMVGKSIVVVAVLAAVAGTGAYLAASAAGSGGNQTTITANNNVIINIGAGEVGMTPEAFKAVVETAIVDKKALAENSVHLFKPARADKNASLTFDDNDSVRFPSDVIAATPATVKREKPDQTKDYSDSVLHIRATDLDHLKSGWAGTVPGVIEDRIAFKLAENINPADLNQMQVRADITVFYKLKTRGAGSERTPDYVLIRNVIK